MSGKPKLNIKKDAKVHDLDCLNSELDEVIAKLNKAEQLLSNNIYSFNANADYFKNLKELLKKFNRLTNLIEYENSKKETLLTKIKQKIQSYFAGIKKYFIGITVVSVFENLGSIFDTADEAWDGMKGILPPKLLNTIGPYLGGGASFFIHLTEIFSGATEAHKYVKNENAPQRKTNIVSNIIISALGFVGVTFSIGWILGAASIIVPFASLLPAAVCVVFTAIYAVKLWRTSYTLHETLRAEPEELKKIEGLMQLICDKEVELNNKRKKTSDEEALSQFIAENKRTYEKYYAKQKELVYKKTLLAEREVAFATLEIVISVLTVVGTILLVGSIVGGSIASFGTLPIALLVGGAVLGVCKMVYEWVDNKFDITKKIKNFFTHSSAESKSTVQQITPLAVPTQSKIATMPSSNKDVETTIFKLDEDNEKPKKTNKGSVPNKTKLDALCTLAEQLTKEIEDVSSLPVTQKEKHIATERKKSDGHLVGKHGFFGYSDSTNVKKPIVDASENIHVSSEIRTKNFVRIVGFDNN